VPKQPNKSHTTIVTKIIVGTENLCHSLNWTDILHDVAPF